MPNSTNAGLQKASKQLDRPDSLTPAQAAELLDFVAAIWDHIGVLLIPCEAGMSRSPGVAAGLSRIYYGDDEPWSEYDFPNSLVYRRMVDQHRQRVQGS